jgi:hypothetical protein
MDHIGIDVHKKESQICILSEGGELVEPRRTRDGPSRGGEGERRHRARGSPSGPELSCAAAVPVSI